MASKFLHEVHTQQVLCYNRARRAPLQLSLRYQLITLDAVFA
jgi:hypothetical protein